MEASPQRISVEEERVDEVVADSFPASDAPAWNATHAGLPLLRTPAIQSTPEAMRALLGSDIERLSRMTTVADRGQLFRAREEEVAHALLAAGRPVVREPVDEARAVRMLESEQGGTMRDASCVVVAARYDRVDVSGIAAMLAVSRALAGVELLRNVRFAALADAPSAAGIDGYVDRLSKTGVNVHAMFSFARLDLARENDESLLFVGNLSSWGIVHTAARAFERASRIGVRPFVLPSWLPGVRASEAASFWRSGWPALMIADGPPWRLRSSIAPDVDRIAAALPGLVAAVTRLANA